MRSRPALLLHLSLALLLPLASAETVITITALSTRSEFSGNYCADLLQKALTASQGADEIIHLRHVESNQYQARMLANLNNLPNSVAWSMADKNRNQALMPISIPLFKGLLGMRVFIIRKQDQMHFDQIESLEDLQQLVAGQGAHWPDTHILRSNGLKVATAMDANLLVKMLKAERFDYYPRGVVEAWHELNILNDPTLAVEKNILLVYHADLYFYVGAGNHSLAERIERGLGQLQKTGEFDRYFYSHQRIVEALRQLEAAPRRVFYLDIDGVNARALVENNPDWYQAFSEDSNPPHPDHSDKQKQLDDRTN
ncbi:hypothetical protein [Cellvibrio sp. KY-YJ-3]|uniref:hypothetical protein n=1 Tax=Cellvibrio sp. KY-YJ-3 TaxID=454662 RepID=UPI001248510A|nr:hypothetical protein [Cellvibrio sp. KY-YJ-3]QEY11614.1 hypothetical protein D0B88_04630 [Cellvibrio sp. KY-YJ-3]